VPKIGESKPGIELVKSRRVGPTGATSATPVEFPIGAEIIPLSSEDCVSE
jgi:hypothetical protein